MPINEEHPVMNNPKENYILWRYMDIPTFLSLLTKSSLTFIRADLLEDKYEGKLPTPVTELIDFKMNQRLGKYSSPLPNSKFSESLNNQNRDIFLNCWCKENYEMVHMWKIYSKENGVAIETTYEKLKEALLSEETIYPTEILYLDYKNDFIEWKSNGLTAFTIKRKEYKSENELRLIIPFPRVVEEQIELLNISAENRLAVREKLYKQTPAIECNVDIAKLISRIYISPYAPKWYHRIISDIIKKYGLEKIKIVQSDL